MNPIVRILIASLAVVLGACAAPGPGAYQPSGKIEVQWLGQAAFKITTVSGKVIVIDPWLRTNPKTPPEYKDLGALGKVDLVLVTHGHFDHVADAPDLVTLNKARFIAPPGLLDSLTSVGAVSADLTVRMNKSGISTPIGPEIKINMVRAEHSSEYVWTDPKTKQRQTLPGGEPVGYVIELENGFKIYHMGDTGLFGDMRFIGEFYKPDLVLLPIGGNFTINPQLGAYAIREMIKPRFAVPMHYGTFPILAGRPEEFVKALGDVPTRVFVIEPGQKLTF